MSPQIAPLHTAHEPESNGGGRRRRTPARQEATTT